MTAGRWTSKTSAEIGKTKKHDIDVVVDRLIIKEAVRKRLADSLELALAQAGGLVAVDIPDKETILFSEKSACICMRHQLSRIFTRQLFLQFSPGRLPQLRRPGMDDRIGSGTYHSQP